MVSMLVGEEATSARDVPAWRRSRGNRDATRRALPVAGDDPEAKALVGALIDAIGFDVGNAARDPPRNRSLRRIKANGSRVVA